jgi:hypothetical protein
MLKTLLSLAALISIATITSAYGQVEGVDLNGPWVCVARCDGGTRGIITQTGWNANVASNHGLASRGHLDYPGRVWFWQINVGALYPPDGCRLQFDNGTIWVRPHRFPGCH